MAVLGIDPGKSGALALVDNVGAKYTFKLSNTERDVWDCLKEWKPYIECAYLERVSAMPRQGVSSTFKFGTSYGFLRGVLVALEVPFEAVTPAKWQRAMSCLTKGDKNVTKSRAQELFPEVKVTHAIADALLIAEYGRRIRIDVSDPK